MSHTWTMKGKWENQDWHFSKNGGCYVIVTEKCNCEKTRKVKFKRIFKVGEII